MNRTIYLFNQLLILLLVLALIASTLYAIRFVLQKRKTEPQVLKRFLQYIGGGFFCWLALLSVLSLSGFFTDFQSLPPKILIAVIPPVGFTIYLLFSKSFTKILFDLPTSWLIYIQSFRIPMELLLWFGFLGGFVPFQMTFEGLNYDILVGITALMAGYVFFYRGRYLRFEAIIWNISGLTLLFNILLISILSTPSPFRVFMNEPANYFIAHFPFIWIPGFIVPFAFAMHLFSLKQLYLKKAGRRKAFLEGKLKR